MPDGVLSECSIENVGKQRNGKPRFWCRLHRANATGKNGTRLIVCEGATQERGKSHTPLKLNPSDYPGGIALWGAVDAAYDTTQLASESGIHVHARGTSAGSKEIDDTFEAVAVTSPKHDLLGNEETLITADTAVNFYLSRFLKRDIKCLHCTYCNAPHLDAGFFAIKPHRRHLCHACGRYFNDSEKGISNPIASLHTLLNLPDQNVAPIRAPRVLDIRQLDYPAGIQVWASNPALVWTSDRPEEEGLHVHLLRTSDHIEVDDTFDKVTIDGIELNEMHVQYFMAQQALPYLANKIVSLFCPHCEAAHFDDGELGFDPHIEHECKRCGETFIANGRRRAVISNPFVTTRNELKSALTRK